MTTSPKTSKINQKVASAGDQVCVKETKTIAVPNTFNAATFSIKGKALKLNSAEDAQPYVKEIEAIKNLEQIVLSGNTIGVEASKALSVALAKHKTIKIANLSDIFTGRLKSEIPLCLEAFVDALEIQPKLESIDFSDNAFGPAGAKPLMRLLRNNRNISTISINNNGLGIGGGECIATALLEAADLNDKEIKPSNLRKVVIGRNRLESPGITFLSKAFKRHTGLIEVRMPQNGIRPEGIKTLLESLVYSTDLEVLDLQDNTFTKEGSLACVVALSKWKSLRILNIGECLLGAEGSLAVLNALVGTHCNLEHLMLSYNEMDVKGAAIVPSVLADKPYISKLELNGNAFDAECSEVKAIRDTLRDIGQEDALDELDDMEVSSDEEEEEEEDVEEKESSDVDELATLTSNLKM